MESRRARIARRACGAIWLVGLAIALKLGATIVEPAPMLGLLAAVYLGGWGFAFAQARGDQAGQSARFVACTVAIVLVVLVFEIPALTGVVDYRGLFANPAPAWLRSENRPDPELLYVRRGGRRVRRTFVGDEIHRLRGVPAGTLYQSDLTYDRNGFRNPPDLRTADTIVIGDSFIEGAHVADVESITARLGETLGGTVANLGRAGYGPQQELQVLRRYGIALHPRTCVWAFYEGNDLDDASRYEADRAAVERSLRHAPSGLAFDRSFTKNALRFVIRTWLSPEPRWPARRYRGEFVDRAGKPVAIYFASGDYPRDRDPEPIRLDSPRLERLRSVLAEAQGLCRANGIRLVLVFIPTKWRVYRNLCTFDRDAACVRWGRDDALPRAIKAVAGGISGEIDFVDLTPTLRAEAAAGGLVYLPDDTHWSAEGHRIAASALAERLDPGSLASRGRP